MTRSWFKLRSWHIVRRVEVAGDVLRVTRWCNGQDVRTVTPAQLLAVETPDGRTCELCYRYERR